ncbi:succinate dehydrogenase, cytochrome b556 subunit [Stappia sp. BW2]|uniref:succinate dehydrogenase, cytochrome b556 subunit n=1 Tax=Stappia sp. BW2 TaxID=2592622 RepID=UPI0011DEA196|nr:succinate dehydrogenase, cytochrome b556 subunit [Stappia sp. BW2]TYC64063.1 succinate dehydrogenase, cytochrome b556 subunit [Stappia sp. BW2]
MTARSTTRPLSPHLQHYRPEITSILSVLHRATGIVLGLGAVGLAWWITALALGGSAQSVTHWLLTSWLGYLALFGWTFALGFHLCNGVRHLFWDAGMGFEMDSVRRSGKAAVGGALLLTVIVWIVVIV